MRSNIKNISLTFIFAFWIILLCQPFLDTYFRPSIYFLKVGQGESVLIKTKEKTIIFDTGPIDNAVLPQLGELLPPWQNNIDLIIISHLHDDHLGGLPAILDRYNVREIWLGVPLDKAPLSMCVQEKIITKHIKVRQVTKPTDLNLDHQIHLTTVHPIQYTPSKDAHFNGVVIRLDSPKTSILLTGDLDQEEEEAIIKSCRNLLNVDILQIPHHGSKYGLIDEFINDTTPFLAIITVGENNFGHPDSGIIQKLINRKIQIRRTDQDGTIKINL